MSTLTGVGDVFDLDRLRFHEPLYTIAEAARYLDVPVSTFATWALGYVRRPPGRPEHRGEPFVTALPVPPGAPPGWPRIPFVGLAEGMTAAAFRRARVPVHKIRKAAAILTRELGVAHPLASNRLHTDGSRILYDYATAAGDTQLVDVLTGQGVLADVVHRVKYAPDGWAQRLVLPITKRKVVEVDPARGFGRPLLIRSGARMQDVVGRWRAGEPMASIAADFDADPDDVEDVLRAATPSPPRAA